MAALPVARCIARTITQRIKFREVRSFCCRVYAYIEDPTGSDNWYCNVAWYLLHAVLATPGNNIPILNLFAGWLPLRSRTHQVDRDINIARTEW